MTDGQLDVEELKHPTGLTVIENKFLFVCGGGSHNLHEISCLCEHIKVLLNSRGKPQTVMYDRTNNRIYNGFGWGNNFVSVFMLE